MLNLEKKDIFKEERNGLIDFHGHACGGLYLGMRVVDYAKNLFNYQDIKDLSKNLVVVTETDMCGVDAIQYLCSCTYGKGNLIHKDYGKNAFTFYDTQANKAIRIYLKSDLSQVKAKELAQKLDPEIQKILEEDEKNIYFLLEDVDLFHAKSLPCTPPRPPRVLESLLCAACEEYVMESRIRHLGGQLLCIPCFNAKEQKV